jgi:hypothetical protein
LDRQTRGDGNGQGAWDTGRAMSGKQDSGAPITVHGVEKPTTSPHTCTAPLQYGYPPPPPHTHSAPHIATHSAAPGATHSASRSPQETHIQHPSSPPLNPPLLMSRGAASTYLPRVPKRQPRPWQPPPPAPPRWRHPPDSEHRTSLSQACMQSQAMNKVEYMSMDPSEAER